MSNQIRRRQSEWPYPRSVLELDSYEKQRLASVFHLHSTRDQGKNVAQIQQLIDKLPNRLKCGPIRRLTTRLDLPLCRLHKHINPYLVKQYFQLIKKEVTTGLKQMDAFPELTGPVEAEILQNVRAIRGMWLRSGTRNVPSCAWEYQIDRCGGCQVSRVVSNKALLREIRAVALSRQRTQIKPPRKDRRRQPRVESRLVSFLDECVGQFDKSVAEELMTTSLDMSKLIKEARKKCVLAWRSDKSQSHKHKYKAGSSDVPAKRHPSLQPDVPRKFEDQGPSRGGPSASRPRASQNSENRLADIRKVNDAFMRLPPEQQSAAMEKVFQGLQRPTLDEQLSEVHKFFQRLAEKDEVEKVYQSLRRGTLDEQRPNIYSFFQDLEYEMQPTSSQIALVPGPLQMPGASRVGRDEQIDAESNAEVEMYLQQLRRQSDASLGHWTDDELGETW